MILDFTYNTHKIRFIYMTITINMALRCTANHLRLCLSPKKAMNSFQSSKKKRNSLFKKNTVSLSVTYMHAYCICCMWRCKVDEIFDDNDLLVSEYFLLSKKFTANLDPTMRQAWNNWSKNWKNVSLKISLIENRLIIIIII